MNGESGEKEGGKEAADNQLCEDVVLGEVIWVKLNGSSWWPAQVVSERCKPSNRTEGEVPVRLYGSYKYLYVDSTRCRSEFASVLEENNGNYHEIMMETLKQDLVNLKSGRSKRQGSRTKGIVRTLASEDKIANQQTTIGQEMESQTSGSSSLGRETAASVAKTRRKNGNSLPPKTSVGKRKGQMQNGLQKKVKPNNLSPQTPKGAEMPKTPKSQPESAPTSIEESQERSARKVKVMQSLGLIAPSGSPFHPKCLNDSKLGRM